MNMCTVKRGRNEIVRRSIESSVTIPHEVTYRNQGSNRPAANSDAAPMFNFCGCGWPQNMLIAKGSPEGFQCQLFVMVSNGEIDQVCNILILILLIRLFYKYNYLVFKIHKD